MKQTPNRSCPQCGSAMHRQSKTCKQCYYDNKLPHPGDYGFLNYKNRSLKSKRRGLVAGNQSKDPRGSSLALGDPLPHLKDAE